MPRLTTLLIDGDVEAFKAASVTQENIDWGDGDISVDTNAKGAEDYLFSALSHYQEDLKADRLIVCLSAKDNWRKKLWPDYKANRKDLARPLLLQHCREYLTANYDVECWDRLEADDVMGILSNTIDGSIIVSVDKDMRGVPCRLYNPGRANDGVVGVTFVDAFKWHMMQTLMGDSTDGYKGCPGIGPKKAAALIDPHMPDLTDGPASVIDHLWDFECGKVEVWKAVVKMYESKGLKQEYALVQARLSYILRLPEEYNRKTAKIRLWQPPTLS